MNDSGPLSIENIAERSICFCWTNFVFVIEVANSNGKELRSRLDCRNKILPDNAEILKNWQGDLQKFLTIEEEPPTYTTPAGRVKRRISVIGKLQGGQNTLTGILDVAMIPSLGKSERLEELVQSYGMVLMDECHHTGADTDTAVLRSVTAKYVYGLTATPKRDDGQDRKIFLQFGPIRFWYTAKDRAKKQGIGKYIGEGFNVSRKTTGCAKKCVKTEHHCGSPGQAAWGWPDRTCCT